MWSYPHPAHELKDRARKASRGDAYNASCRCGWTSPSRVTAQRAYRDLDEHAAPFLSQQPPDPASQQLLPPAVSATVYRKSQKVSETDG